MILDGQEAIGLCNRLGVHGMLFTIITMTPGKEQPFAPCALGLREPEHVTHQKPGRSPTNAALFCDHAVTKTYKLSVRSLFARGTGSALCMHGGINRIFYVRNSRAQIQRRCPGPHHRGWANQPCLTT